MKKLLSIWIMIAYMASAIGFSCSLHYCGGKFKEVCFTADTEKNCCGSMEKSAGCCSDKVIKAQIKDNHTAGAKTILAKAFFFIVPAKYSYIYSRYIPIESFEELTLKGPAPPLLPQSVPIYLKNRVIRV